MILALKIGDYVHIGKNTIICKGCIINNCSQILPNSVVVENTHVSPFTVFGGNPAQKMTELPSTTIQLMIEATTKYYKSYLPVVEKKGIWKCCVNKLYLNKWSSDDYFYLAGGL